LSAGTEQPPPSSAPARSRASFGEDFRRFFLSGVAALLPTLITFWLMIWAWNFLWEYLGQHIIFGIKWIWLQLASAGLVEPQPAHYIGRYWSGDDWSTRLVGVLLAVLLVYLIGVVVGNFIGRTFYRVLETAVMRIPLVRAIYPSVKQVTDFVLRNRRSQFIGSRVVAVQPHEKNIWSIGLVTGEGLKPLSDATGDEMVTVFVPSTPTAFTGYVLVVPRNSVVELPMTVEDAMRMLVSGGVIMPDATSRRELSGEGMDSQILIPPDQPATTVIAEQATS
jgi:uncharacterized membrane protein